MSVPNAAIPTDYNTLDNKISVAGNVTGSIIDNTINTINSLPNINNNNSTSLANSNRSTSNTNGIISASTSDTGSGVRKSLALEPNPFEQSFAQTEEHALTQSEMDLINKNRLINSIDKRLVKPQSDTQLSNLRYKNQQQQLQEQQQIQASHPQAQSQISPSSIDNCIVTVKSDPLIQQNIKQAQAQQSLNYGSMSPPVLTPGGPKRSALNVLPPLTGFLSPGGNSLVGSANIWNSIFPPTPGAQLNQQQQQQLQQLQHHHQQQVQLQQLQQQQLQQQNLPHPQQYQLSSLPNGTLNIPALGQLSPNTLLLTQQQLQLQQHQQNKNFSNLQKQIHELQQAQQQVSTLPTSIQEQQAQQLVDQQLKDAQKQVQEAQREVEIHTQALAAAQAQVQAVQSQTNLTKQVQVQRQQQQQQQQAQVQGDQNLQQQTKRIQQTQQMQLTQAQTQTAMENEIINMNKTLMNDDGQDPVNQISGQSQPQSQLMNLFFNAKRSGLTPNESSMRTGLTPGPGGIIGSNSFYSYLGMAADTFSPLGVTNTGLGNLNSKPPTVSTGLTGLLVPTLGSLDVTALPNVDSSNIVKTESVNTQNDGTTIAYSKDTASTINESENNTPGLIMKDIPHPNLNVSQKESNNTTLVNDPSVTLSSPGNKKRKIKTEEIRPSRAKRTKKALAPLENESRRTLSELENEKTSPPPLPAATSTKPKTRKKNLTEEEKRQNFLERNRLAASKCRQRKKSMVEKMKHDIVEYKNENDSLREQVGILREHALTLRTILYAHRECALLVKQVGGVESLNAVLNSTNYVSQLPEAHKVPESISVEDIPSLLNGSSTNTQAAVAAAIAHTTNKAIERSNN